MKELKIVARGMGKIITTLLSYAGFWWLFCVADIEDVLEEIGIDGAAAMILLITVVAIVSYHAVNNIVRQFRYMIH